MTRSQFNLENFNNDDPRILTVLLIGMEENVKAHILRQHTLGLTEAGEWSKPLSILNSPNKVLCIVNRIMA